MTSKVNKREDRKSTIKFETTNRGAFVQFFRNCQKRSKARNNLAKADGFNLNINTNATTVNYERTWEMICLSEKYRQKYSKRLRTLYLIISWTTFLRKNRTKKMTTISWRLSNLPKYANFSMRHVWFSYTFRIPNANTRHLCLKSK